MIPKDCKRLAEVDFPIAEVSRHAVRENSIRHGRPSALHLWWARRPLASSRAVLLALLLPDPCHPLCPREFKAKAREVLLQAQGKVGTADEDLRKALLKFIADFANWDLASNRTYLDVGRALVKAAHGEELPLVVDPFAGGGSIPLEALRLGCETFASDLNPVACLILKVMLEDIPRHGPELAEELRRVGSEIKRQAENDLADLYPKDPDGMTPIAYLWARTVRCEAPNCGAEIPLVRSFWLCKKASRRSALRYRIVRQPSQPPRVEFDVVEPKTATDVPGATVTSAKATCIACSSVLPSERVRAQLTSQHGGAEVIFDAQDCRKGGARILAVVTLRASDPGRHYRLPTERDYAAVNAAQKRVTRLLDEWRGRGKQGLCPVPDEAMNPVRPSPSARGVSAVTRYGMRTFGDLFTARQKAALTTIAVLCESAPSDVAELVALCVSKLADLSNSGCRWEAFAECPRQLFARQAIPMVWDFSEGVATSESSGSFGVMVDLLCRTLKRIGTSWGPGQVQLADAAEHPLPDQTASRGGVSRAARADEIL
jgi:putative DNA methylase